MLWNKFDKLMFDSLVAFFWSPHRGKCQHLRPTCSGKVYPPMLDLCNGKIKLNLPMLDLCNGKIKLNPPMLDLVSGNIKLYPPMLDLVSGKIKLNPQML